MSARHHRVPHKSAVSRGAPSGTRGSRSRARCRSSRGTVASSKPIRSSSARVTTQPAHWTGCGGSAMRNAAIVRAPVTAKRSTSWSVGRSIETLTARWAIAGVRVAAEELKQPQYLSGARGRGLCRRESGAASATGNPSGARTDVQPATTHTGSGAATPVWSVPRRSVPTPATTRPRCPAAPHTH